MSQNYTKIIFIDETWSWKIHTLLQFLESGTPSWDFFQKEDTQKILTTISKNLESYKNKTIYPPIDLTFKAFYVPEKSIKLVILGQDPYHNGSATGHCFEVKNGNKINPSLKNIYKELQNEGFKIKEDGDLQHLKNQGILLLNTSLTVLEGRPESHLEYWLSFTEKLLEYISTKNPNILWLLMGAKAYEFRGDIKTADENIFVTSHPSPFSAMKGFRNFSAFMGSGVFKKINDRLEELDQKRIEW